MRVRPVPGDGPVRRHKAFAVLPTLLTLGNAVCGFGAITFAAGWAGADPAVSMLTAATLIYLAMVFDALDGSAARWANQTTDFGAELDSLCDAVSFGAAPALLVLQFSRPLGYHPRVLWLVTALYLVCTVLRLARFNSATEEAGSKGYFRGLPSPAAAGTVASVPVMALGPKYLEYPEHDLLGGEFSAGMLSVAVSVLPVITLAVAVLMVSRIRYTHTFHQLFRGRRGRRHIIKLVFAAAVIFAAPQVSAPLLFGWYAFVPPVVAAYDRLRGRPKGGVPLPDQADQTREPAAGP